LRISKKKFIYVISPNIISKNFYQDLRKILRTSKVSFFQMRFKKYSFEKKIIIGKKIKKICELNKVKFIVNDDPILAKKLKADGCHLGQDDMNIKKARKILKNKIIGITCHNSILLAKKAKKFGADYVAFGSFFSTKTKKIKHYAHLNLIKWANKKLKLPVVAIGGININNYKIVLESGANLIAMSNFIWKNNKNIKGF
jgi:thiamine-phosphate pyrophosphorylase